MPSVFQNLQFAAQSLTFLTPAQLVHRAKLVDADFAAIGLKYQLACQEIPVRGWRGRLPYASYQLLGSQCDVNNAHRGDRRHTSMSGGDLDRECILYFSKVAEWAHAHVPHLWPGALRHDLCESANRDRALSSSRYRPIRPCAAVARFVTSIDPPQKSC